MCSKLLINFTSHAIASVKYGTACLEEFVWLTWRNKISPNNLFFMKFSLKLQNKTIFYDNKLNLNSNQYLFIFLYHHMVFNIIVCYICTNVNWMDFYLWYFVYCCFKVLSNKQILLVDNKRQHQTNWKLTIEYPLRAYSHWIDGGLLILKC